MSFFNRYFLSDSNAKIRFERPNIKIARFTMIKHKPGVKNPKRKYLLKHAVNRINRDGLNTIKYKLNQTNHPYYTHLYVNVGDPSEYISEIGNFLSNSTSNNKTSRTISVE